MPSPQNTTITFSKGQWFCIGTSGKTIDGRDIQPEWLEQAAEDYDLEVYGARINVEHLRSLWPESELSGYGDVIALKAESAGGITKLFAQLDPTDKLIALNKKREKIYTSMELNLNFQEKQRAYLTGLAITDSPSSVGTSALHFSADPNSPFSIKPEYLISESTAMTKATENTQAQQDAAPKTEDQAPSWFTKFFSKPAPEAKAEAADLQEFRTQTEAGFKAAGEAIQDLKTEQDEKFNSLLNEVKSLRQELSQQPAPPQEDNKPHTGADASVKYTAPQY